MKQVAFARALPGPYGAQELKKVYQWNMTKGLGIATILICGAIASYRPSPVPVGGDVIVTVYPQPNRGFPAIPSIPEATQPIKRGEGGRKKLGGEVANPIPVASPVVEKTIATNKEFAETPGDSLVDSLLGSQMGGDGGISMDIPEGPPPVFVPVEKDPVAVYKVTPAYPEMARRAELQGSVFVKMWVDREGRVRDAIVQKSDYEIFNDAAVAAARQFVFTPAIMNKGPVSVWVSMPFRFRISDKADTR